MDVDLNGAAVSWAQLQAGEVFITSIVGRITYCIKSYEGDAVDASSVTTLAPGAPEYGIPGDSDRPIFRLDDVRLVPVLSSALHGTPDPPVGSVVVQGEKTYLMVSRSSGACALRAKDGCLIGDLPKEPQIVFGEWQLLRRWAGVEEVLLPLPD